MRHIASQIPKHKHTAEVAKFLARELLAEQVRNKIEADLGEDDDPNYVVGDNVVEILEELVEGDVVLDDAAEHRWFLNKLTQHRDLEMKLDGMIPAQMEK